MAQRDDDIPVLNPHGTPTRERRPLHPVGVAGVAALAAALAAGLLAWMWLGDWRWAVTGVAAMLVLLVTGSSLEARR